MFVVKIDDSINNLASRSCFKNIPLDRKKQLQKYMGLSRKPKLV